MAMFYLYDNVNLYNDVFYCCYATREGPDTRNIIYYMFGRSEGLVEQVYSLLGLLLVGLVCYFQTAP